MFLEPEPFGLRTLFSQEIEVNPDLPQFKKRVKKIQDEILRIYLAFCVNPTERVTQAILSFDFSELNYEDWVYFDHAIGNDIPKIKDCDVEKFKEYVDVSRTYAMIRKYIYGEKNA
jgi:hypothetical protein